MRKKILLVDDDENILEGYKRILRKECDVTIANSGMEGLGILRQCKDYAVVVSDYKMPSMNGVEFLKYVKQITPDAVRILLTGYADAKTSIQAVNEGNIFRLLTKPCSIENLLITLNAAYKQFELIIAERELLDKTLKGSTKVLIDILSIVNPDAFKQANQIKNIAANIAKRLNIENYWEIEVAALLSQIGCVSIPNDIVVKKNRGEKLTLEEEKLFSSHPDVGSILLQNIPRLENIAKLIKYQLFENDLLNEDINKKFENEIPIGSKILKVLNDYYFYGNLLENKTKALRKIKENANKYDRNVIIALDAELAGIYEGLKIESVTLIELNTGSVLADDVKDVHGSVLITRGAEISEIMKLRLLNYNKTNQIEQPIKIFQLSTN
jgi:response regulator RpfG family c-di-GMP phosphodiesterase